MRSLLKLVIVGALAWPAAAFTASPQPQQDIKPQQFQQQVEQMLAGGEADRAYRWLKDNRQLAGEAWYEYLLARAALDIGRIDEAVAGLERYVAANPDQDPPQFHLARAYVKAGAPDRAVAQYRRIYQHTAFETSRERAREELARMGELPVIAVGDPEHEAQADALKPKEFPPEESLLAGEAFLGAGFDTNANSGTDADRYFFYDLAPEQRNSDSFYLEGGGSVALSHAFGPGLAWRSGLGVNARSNPDAHFADTQDVSAQTQLRWRTSQHRLTGGLVYSVSFFDGKELSNAAALVARLETLTRALLLSVDSEIARLRYPDVPLRDIDSFFVRVKATPAPDPKARWVPRVVGVIGFEEETREASPFGRNLWGVLAGVERVLGPQLRLDGEVGFTKSLFDEAFTQPDHRSDNRVQAELFAHWQPAEKSRWTHSLGARFRMNDSNEPLYDFERLMVGYELGASFGGAQQ